MADFRGRLLANQAQAIEAVLGNKQLPADANPGLVFDRYLRLWDFKIPPRLVKKTRENPSYDQVVCLKTFAKDLESNNSKHRLKLLHERQIRFCGLKKLHSKEELFQAKDPLALGLGNAHPLGNGFVFDPTAGVPYFPGSSVKGLMRAAGRLELAYADLDRWFGPEGEPGAKLYRGELIVLDAYPSEWPKLEADIINCHHSQYYTQKKLPVETESPVPVFFLTVKENSRWTFRLASRTLSEKELNQAISLLKEGLEWLGIGGKTATGYGSMIENPETRSS